MSITGANTAHTLTNGIIGIGVQNAGAELTSLRSASTGLEYMWQADPTFWGKHAPVLFPIVGRLKDDAYLYDGASYHMKQHGLARTRIFETAEKSETGISFRLRHDDKTRALYPFRFELVIAYTLDGDRLRVGYDVINLGIDPMFFSIGAHPGFRCPLLPGESYEEYRLVFDRAVTQERYLLDDGLVAAQAKPFLNDQRELPLSRAMFDRDAIVLKGAAFARVALEHQTSGHGVTMDMEGFPYFGIWAKPGADFVCLEPWYGIADGVDASGRLEDKEGIIALDGGEVFRASYSITPM